VHSTRAMRTSRAHFAAAALTAAITTTGCVDTVDDPSPQPDENDEGEVTPLTGDTVPPSTYGVFEVGNTWPKDSLSVCWLSEIFDSAEAHVQELRVQGENTVKREWGRTGRVRLTGFGRCAAGSTTDIRIGFETQPGVAGHSKIGTDALLVPPGQPTMGLTFLASVPGCPPDVGNLCNTTPDSLTAQEKLRFDHLILHEFGHALGLRHEHAHEQSTCEFEEPLDQSVFDGESIFAFDSSSVMSYCSGGAVLSNGDIRSLHTLYPGVVGLYADPNFVHGFQGMGQPILLGPGYYTTTQVPALNTISGIVVPPGYSVRICNTSTCTIATTNRNIPSPYNNAIQNILISPVVLGSELFGYQGITEQIGSTANAPFGTLGDNQMKSLFPAPTRAARVCIEPDGGSTCAGPFVGGSIPDAFRLPPGVFHSVSHIEVSKRVVTYSGLFTGTSNALGVGVFKSTTNAPFLPSVKSLAISGLEVRACTEVGVSSPIFPGGAGDCRTYTQSVDLATQSPPHTGIKFLQIKFPLVVGP
jgi:hypothetical protein